MDVYLVPIGADSYELYCEESVDVGGLAEPPRGFVRRLRLRFAQMLSEAERERHAVRTEPAGWAGRIQSRTRRWIAESIAEQRLLWHLRNQTSVCLYYPDDIEERHASEILRRHLSRDFDKHRTWLLVDALAFLPSLLLTVLPGPNLVSYYFGFRMVGHYLSLRGARQGLRVVSWANEGSAPLTDLRRAIGLDPELRKRRVQDVAVALRLEHLATFFQRMAIP